MENRERDRVSKRSTPTEAGQLNRSVEEEKGREVNSGTTAEFGQSIGRSENLSEGGEMRNRNQDEVTSGRNVENENQSDSGRRSSGSSNYGSSSGRSGSMGNVSSGNKGSKSDMNSDEIGSSGTSGSKNSNRGSSGELGSTGSSSGRH